MFLNPVFYEYQFWYVIHSAAYYANTYEKRRKFREFLYLFVPLFPCKRCEQNKISPEILTYILYHEYPLLEHDIQSNEDLMKWVQHFQKIVEGPNCTNCAYSNKPTDFGPHWWFVIHTCASNANTIEKRRMFVDMMKKLCLLIPCQKCSEHATEFVYKKDDPENYIHSKVDLFHWTYRFHEYANDNTKKQRWLRPSWDEVYHFYNTNFGK